MPLAKLPDRYGRVQDAHLETSQSSNGNEYNIPRSTRIKVYPRLYFLQHAGDFVIALFFCQFCSCLTSTQGVLGRSLDSIKPSKHLRLRLHNQLLRAILLISFLRVQLQPCRAVAPIMQCIFNSTSDPVFPGLCSPPRQD